MSCLGWDVGITGRSSKTPFWGGFDLGLIHNLYFFRELRVHEYYHLMQMFVFVSLTHANNRPAPLFSSMKCIKEFFQGGRGQIYYHEGGGTSKVSVSSETQRSFTGD